MRVPPAQSGAAAAARSIASSGWRPASARVSRVRRVAKTNASAFAPPTHACRNCRNARAYGSIEPEMSQSTTSRRGRCAGAGA